VRREGIHELAILFARRLRFTRSRAAAVLIVSSRQLSADATTRCCATMGLAPQAFVADRPGAVTRDGQLSSIKIGL
jgi:hypothetical protein